jgi:phosphotransferase system  glucose/maltose/N-acetylglucosamine-specific IIC component
MIKFSQKKFTSWLLKKKFPEIKQWIKTHPKTTVYYILCLFAVSVGWLLAVEFLKLGAMIQRGDIANPLSSNQVTGLLFTVISLVLCLIIWFFFEFFQKYIVKDIQEAEDKKAEEKK